MYCITIDNSHYDVIKKIDYIPVGLGKNITRKDFLSDKSGDNISEKNPFYGEYTFHYWLWKNKFDNSENNWLGFCQYRKFWSLSNKNKNYIEFKDFKKDLLNEIPQEYQDCEVILGEPLFINQFKLSKFLKKFFKIIKNPSILINKKRNIKFHFDLMHGEGNLDKAIALLNKHDKDDFKKFVYNEVSFNPHNMFICKSNKILNNYYESVFPWLEKCEKEFGFDLHGYGLKRIYGFLAERYMSFWFKKYTKHKTMPIIFKDLNDFL